MRTTIAAFLAASLLTTLLAPAARAAPTQVNVRVEGRAETLFEGPILTGPHRVSASSDSQWRLCNGINVNDPLNTAPAPVPTSASADAMRTVGETFDGQWYGQYEDYFLTRWGPDEQNPAANQYWGIVVNNVFTSVGGCQYQLDGGDEVLWIYGAFNGRPRLGLYPVGYSGGSTPLTATATLNQPFEVEVDTWSGYNEGAPPASPQRSTTPFGGAEVAPVLTNAKGFEEVDTASSETVTTVANGLASIVFTESGWHRIKATKTSGGSESAIRSNRLDVCVPQPPATGCGALPAEDQVRTPPPPVAGEEEPEEPDAPEAAPPAEGGAPGTTAAGAATAAGQVRLQLSRPDRSRVARGLVKVSWRVLDAGVGIGKWTVSSLTLGRKGARYVNRASGRDATAATLHLPPGATYGLRLAVVDALGRSSTASLGRVEVPR